MADGRLQLAAGEPTAPGPHQVDAAAFRTVMGRFVTGVTVVTVDGVDGPHGATVNAFTSLSLTPPLVLVCLRTGAHSARAVEQAGVFAVNILGRHQQDLSQRFASRDRPRGRDAFSGVAHRPGVTGAPLLEGSVAYVDCRLAGSLPAGDHTIFVGEVVALDADPEAEPLAFHRGRFSAVA